MRLCAAATARACIPRGGSQLPRRSAPARLFASQASGAPVFDVFNRRTKWLQKERAAAQVETSRQADYLKDEVASRLCERLQDIKRHFPRVLDLGANACHIARALTKETSDPLVDPDVESSESSESSESAPDPTKPPPPPPLPLSTHVSEIIAAESSETMLYRDADLPFNREVSVTRHVLEDAERLPFEPGSFDMVMSSMSLHWVNDLPGVLAQANSLLRPDSPFLAAMLGGDTLFELRTSLQLAEQDRRGGISPHVSPLADVKDVGGLLQRAGFKMLTVDVDDIIVDYPDTFALMQDLQAMGESNAVLGREMGAVGRDVLLANDAIYRALHGNPDGTIPATFRIIYMIGWSESADQPKPLPRGSGEFSLKDVLEKKAT